MSSMYTHSNWEPGKINKGNHYRLIKITNIWIKNNDRGKIGKVEMEGCHKAEKKKLKKKCKINNNFLSLFSNMNQKFPPGTVFA